MNPAMAAASDPVVTIAIERIAHQDLADVLK
jgi:hypothetical protein